MLPPLPKLGSGAPVDASKPASRDLPVGLVPATTVHRIRMVNPPDRVPGPGAQPP